MRIAFELAATVFDSWLAVWFVKKFCRFEDKLAYRLATIFLLVAVTEFSNEYMAQFSVGATLILAVITLIYTAVSSYKIDFRQVIGYNNTDIDCFGVILCHIFTTVLTHTTLF